MVAQGESLSKERTDLKDDIPNGVAEVSGEYLRRARYVLRHDAALRNPS